MGYASNMTFTISKTVATPYTATVAAVRSALADNGFGVLTEIDVQATMKTKLGVDVPAQVILGACRPELAHRAMAAMPSIAALLPCNVVVRESDGGTVIEAIDPNAMMSFAGENAELSAVAADATERISAAIAAVG